MSTAMSWWWMAVTSFARVRKRSDNSMSGKYIIGVDGGSQSSKVVVHDLEGIIVSEGRQALRPMNRPRNGIVEHPDDDLWDSITAASRQAMAKFTGDPRDIIGVGPVSYTHLRAHETRHDLVC